MSPCANVTHEWCRKNLWRLQRFDIRWASNNLQSRNMLHDWELAKNKKVKTCILAAGSFLNQKITTEYFKFPEYNFMMDEYHLFVINTGERFCKRRSDLVMRVTKFKDKKSNFNKPTKASYYMLSKIGMCLIFWSVMHVLGCIDSQVIHRVLVSWFTSENVDSCHAPFAPFWSFNFLLVNWKRHFNNAIFTQWSSLPVMFL